MNDTRLKSLTESGTNLIVGFPINYIANLLILPHYANGFETVNASMITSLEIGFWFTVVSVIRQYGLRRFFNHFGEKENFYTLIIRLGKHFNTRISSYRKF